MESIACGTPVVSSAVWGVPKVITSEAIGFLSYSTDLAMFKTILMALGYKWDRQELVQFVRERNWKYTAQKVVIVFTFVLSDWKRVKQTAS